MAKPLDIFTSESVRDAWDKVADTYTSGQAAGRDYYRYEFFGPAQVELCGDVRGLRVLDLGCGNGYFAREMAKGGAQVAAIDISPRMIEHAKAEQLLAIDYRVLDAAEARSAFAPQTFDLATSCVALCDMPDPASVFSGVKELLKPGGRFVFSITHPCTDAPYRRWEREQDGSKKWLCIDRYFDEGAYEYPWWGWGRDFVTPGLHVTLETWVAWVLAAGFQIRAIREPRPTSPALQSHPGLEDATRVPYFLLFDVVRGSAAMTDR